ncbi:hypothetical protein LCGC14_1366500 [marine sediment metagenome]|uniref:Uncharacterized protein n=1 Tax=marine sediment metagenome TaxID=412755 RepID=A0A0F9KSM0_9ZZZZ
MNIDGTWKVIPLTGWIRLLIGNKKYITNDKGYNRLFGIKWGRFKITEKDGKIIFTYDNGKVIDELEPVRDMLLGDYFSVKDGEKEFVGVFIMVKEKS